MPERKKPDHISQEDWDAVDSPPLTAEFVAGMRPVGETSPHLVEAWRRTRGKQKTPTKQLVSLRLDRDVLDRFRATGDGWQSRINEALKKAAP